jgi:amidase
MLPGLTERTGSGIAWVYDAATAWFLQHWIQRIGRDPGAHELEPITRAYWESGRRVSAADYLQAVQLTSQLEAARPWQSRVPAFSARYLAT